MLQLAVFCTKCATSTSVIASFQKSTAIHCSRCNAVLVTAQPLAGYIYVLSNSEIPGLVKIGFTERPVEERITELSAASGVPGVFRQEASFPVSSPRTLERVIHEKLKHVRVQKNREFFRMTPSAAKSAIREVLGLAARTSKPPATLRSQKPPGMSEADWINEQIAQGQPQENLRVAECGQSASC